MKKIFGALIALCSAFAFGATTVPVQLLNPTGSSSGQAIVSTGASSAPAWGGVGMNGIAAIAANTVVANATGSSASPTAFAMPSCSTTSSILQYTSGTGFACSTTIWASPPAIGGTTAAAGTFTSLTANSNSAVFATNTSGQSIPNGAYTTVTGWTTTFDRNTNFVASTGVFTAPRAGYYIVSAGMTTGSFAWPAGSQISLGVAQNGTLVATSGKTMDAAVTTSQRTQIGGALIKCNANDTIVVQFFQSQGGAVTLSNAAAANQWVSIVAVP